MLLGRSIKELVGQTLSRAEGKKGDWFVAFYAVNGRTFYLKHLQDCCEEVFVEDVCGDMSDLVGSPIVMAEEVTNGDGCPDVPIGEHAGSYTWTLYKLATVKGSVTIRFYGTSNGFYSERVDFVEEVAE